MERKIKKGMSVIEAIDAICDGKSRALLVFAHPAISKAPTNIIYMLLSALNEAGIYGNSLIQLHKNCKYDTPKILLLVGNLIDGKLTMQGFKELATQKEPIQEEYWIESIEQLGTHIEKIVKNMKENLESEDRAGSGNQLVSPGNNTIN